MNVLFLTLVQFESFSEHNIYTDLLREFIKHGYEVYAISPVEKRQNQETHIIREGNATILRIKIGNIQKTNIIEKGCSTIMIEPIFKKAIKKYFPDVKFDLILYSTPPITLVSAINYVRKRDGSKTYLLLKDIFPQNALDLGMMTTKGARGLLYRHFRLQEKKLYSISDYIGCMSPANVDYLLRFNPEILPARVEVCPNSIEVTDKSVDAETRRKIREKYNIPLDKMVFVYGGNLGKPQGIPFLIECLKKCSTLENAFFLIIGDGTEYQLLENYLKTSKQNNLKLMKRLPKEDYDNMVGACDIGMIFLDHRFTIPNFPSRLLSYMQAKLPVLAVTDPNTDIGKVITDGGFGWWCESNDSSKVFDKAASIMRESPQIIEEMKEQAFCYLQDNYSITYNYTIIAEKTILNTIAN